MYHIVEENQVPHKEKSLLIKGFFQKDSQIADYTGDVNYYLGTCTDTQKKIAHIILNYRFAAEIKLTNQTIANIAGCTVKTVTRCTNKFHKDGFLTKSQENRYAPNQFMFNDKVKKGKHAFSYWFNSLSPMNQELYNSHGMRIDHKNKLICSFEYVPQNKSSLILESIFKNLRSYSYAGERNDKKINFLKKGKKLNALQKNMILNNRNDPKIKEVINNPNIKSKIITPLIEKISTLLTFDEREQFKLIAFDEATLEYVYGKLELAIKNKQVPKASYRMEWLILFATQYCNDNNIKPDWRWYYGLCEILAISTNLERKAYTAARIPQSSKPKLRILSQGDRLAKLKFDLKAREERLAIYNGSYGDKKVIEKLKEEISELEGSNEKQRISHQHSTNSMATCTA